MCLDTMGGCDYEEELSMRIDQNISYNGQVQGLEYLDHELDTSYRGAMDEDAISYVVYRKTASNSDWIHIGDRVRLTQDNRPHP